MKANKAGFSIIEILVGIFVFTLGLLSIFMILQSSVNMNEYSKNEIIAANLAKESIDLVKNVRDSNFIEQNAWNVTNPMKWDSKKFEVGKYYRIENDFSDSNNFPVRVEEIENFDEGKKAINDKMEEYRLYLDEDGRYVYKDASSNLSHENLKPTHFYKYIKFEKADYIDGSDTIVVGENENGELEALRLISKVIWTAKGYHEVEIRTIITDWKKL